MSGDRKLYLGGLGTMFFFLALGAQVAVEKAKREYYWNKRFDFCIDYPEDWQGEESGNGDGIFLDRKDPEGYRLHPLSLIHI